jgi:hypothetical protein
VGGAEGAPALVTFQTLASLLLPVEPGRSGVVLEADARWSFRPRGIEADVVIWGRPPLPSGMPLASLTRAMVAREWALQRLTRRPPRPWRSSSVHRWSPPVLGVVGGRERARATMLGGALVQLVAGDPVTRIIDAASAAAGGPSRVARFTAGSGGSILTGLRLATGPAMLRIGRRDDVSDPARGAAALQWLADAGVPSVPRPLESGQVAGARWTLESRLTGVRGGPLAEAMLLEVSRFCARLPVTSAPPTAFVDDLEQIAEAFPHHAQPIKAISTFIRPVLRTLPGITRHGDLWSGNVLLDRGRLSGVVDWDAWHPLGVPGTDLLHVLATDIALRSGRELGSVWRDAPWRSSAFQRLAAEYWPAVDVWPDAATLQAVGIAWWAGSVAHSIACDPTRVGDRRWSKLNVDDVLAALERMVL